MKNVQKWFIIVLTKTILFPIEYTNRMTNCLHMDLKVYVYKKCLNFILKLLLIPHYNGYSTESFIGFSLYVTSFKKSKI